MPVNSKNSFNVIEIDISIPLNNGTNNSSITLISYIPIFSNELTIENISILKIDSHGRLMM